MTVAPGEGFLDLIAPSFSETVLHAANTSIHCGARFTIGMLSGKGVWSAVPPLEGISLVCRQLGNGKTAFHAPWACSDVQTT